MRSRSRSPPVRIKACPDPAETSAPLVTAAKPLAYEEHGMRNASFICRSCLWLLVIAVVVGASMVVVSSAGAQVPPPDPDHLKCYQVLQDTNPREKEIVDLLNDQFGLEKQCTVFTKSPFFCAPTAKFSHDNRLGDDPRGPALQPDYLCYRVECGKRNKQTILVDDQFGQRLITIKDARLLCAPARKIPLTAPPCGQSTAPQCSGLCEVPGTSCQQGATGGCVCQ
jgi:hypothetical protein